MGNKKPFCTGVELGRKKEELEEMPLPASTLDLLGSSSYNTGILSVGSNA